VGTNTVNGVINIITKSSMDTKGGRISIGGGSTHPGDYLARYGGKLGSNAAYRAFGHYSDFNPLTFGTSKANDGWSIGSGGFRLDWNRSKNDSIMVQGNAFQMNGDQTTLIVAPYGGLGSSQAGCPITALTSSLSGSIASPTIRKPRCSSMTAITSA
jgi:outer membrane receptor protein involved in Fe transport